MFVTGIWVVAFTVVMFSLVVQLTLPAPTTSAKRPMILPLISNCQVPVSISRPQRFVLLELLELLVPPLPFRPRFSPPRPIAEADEEPPPPPECLPDRKRTTENVPPLVFSSMKV